MTTGITDTGLSAELVADSIDTIDDPSEFVLR
jgi:hypothetical protein